MNHATFLRRLPAVLFLGVAALALSGCSGDGHSAVEGTVTLDGHPVEGGVIVLVPVGDAPNPPNQRGKAYGPIEGGKYALHGEHGASTGKYRVEITWNKKTGRQVPSSDPPAKMDEVIQVIPKTYNAQSTLFVEVKSGQNNFDFELKSSKHVH